jgi:hypothetical protein
MNLSILFIIWRIDTGVMMETNFWLYIFRSLFKLLLLQFHLGFWIFIQLFKILLQQLLALALQALQHFCLRQPLKIINWLHLLIWVYQIIRMFQSEVLNLYRYTIFQSEKFTFLHLLLFIFEVLKLLIFCSLLLVLLWRKVQINLSLQHLNELLVLLVDQRRLRSQRLYHILLKSL